MMERKQSGDAEPVVILNTAEAERNGGIEERGGTLRGEAMQDRAGETAGYGNKEHVLVCLSSAVSNKKVIRTAARMAEAFQARLTAIYVETPADKELSHRNKAELQDNLSLAEQMGAQLVTGYGEDIAGQIARYAGDNQVSKMVLGRSLSKRQGMGRSTVKATVVDRLTALLPDVDIYIIPYSQPALLSKLKLSSSLSLPLLQASSKPKLSLIDTAKAIGILIACTAIGLWFKHLGLRESNIITVYILGVLLIAMLTGGRLYGVAASVLSVLVFNYFFTEPYHSLKAYDPSYPVTFVVMLASSLLTSTLTMRVREQARQAARKALRTEVLLETSRKLQQAKDFTDIMEETAKQMVKLLDRTVIFYAVEQADLALPKVFPKRGAHPQAEFTNDKERAVAEWVFRNNTRAGATTDKFSHSSCLYFAVRGVHAVFAVAAVAMEQGEKLELFEQNLMIAMLGECALALEKEKLNQKQKEISLQVQQEQLRANLLRAISHDLRTPLTSISGNAGILIGNSGVLSEGQKQDLYTDIYDDSIWLINLVENLLSISRIDNGTLNLNLQAELLEEVISEALQHVNRNSGKHVIQTVLDDELLMARMDSRLIIQVLINLVNNAIKYTQPGSHITISAKRERGMAVVEVSDDGPGIPDAAKGRLFEMFYTANNIRGDGRRGLGLGLSLCKSIIDAHGGRIGVKDREPNGTVFYFTLQAEEVEVYE